MPSELLAWEYALPSLSPIPTKLMIIQLHIGPQSVFLAYVGARVSGRNTSAAQGNIQNVQWKLRRISPNPREDCN